MRRSTGRLKRLEDVFGSASLVDPGWWMEYIPAVVESMIATVPTTGADEAPRPAPGPLPRPVDPEAEAAREADERARRRQVRLRELVARCKRSPDPIIASDAESIARMELERLEQEEQDQKE